jgi:hypothetical protein
MPPKKKGAKRGKAKPKQKPKEKEPPPPPKVVDVTFDPAPGSFLKKTIIKIVSNEEDARVHYTTDGTAPTPDLGGNDDQEFYHKPIIWKAGLLKLRTCCHKEGCTPSFASAEFFIEVDPWEIYKSPFGGKMSQNDEWNKLLQDVKEPVTIPQAQVAGFADGSISGGRLDQMVRIVAQQQAEVIAAAKRAAEAEAERLAAAEGEDSGECGEGGGSGDVVAVSIREETVEGSHVTTIAESKSEGGLHASDGKAIVVKSEAPAEWGTVEHVSIRSCGVTSIDLADAVIARELVLLDLTDNSLSSDDCVQLSRKDDMPCYLRKLVLSGNQLRNLPTIPESCRCKLLCLDLSCNPLGQSMSAIDFSGMPLRYLSLEQCGVQKLDLDSPTGISCLSELLVLDLSLNQLAKKAELDPMAIKLKKLNSLDLSGNPLSGDGDYKDWTMAMRNKLPTINSWDGEGVQVHFAAVGRQELQKHDDEGIPTGDSASCSCVEGNPCADKYNCKHWANRFEVARKAREEGTFTGFVLALG